jgi:CubicO group peptidase (beta-lactamase class C family)
MKLIGGLLLAGVAAAANGSPLQEAVDAYVDADRTRHAAVALVTPDGVETAFAGDGVDADALFEIGSVTKVFTGRLLATLVADGTVAYDDTVGELIPGDRDLAPEVASITLRSLAEHTSGLPRLPENSDFLARIVLTPQDPYAGTTVDAMFGTVASLRAVQLSPKGEYRYSNLGAALLGRLLEQAADKSYETLVRERILTPLALDSTDFSDATVGGHRRNLQPTANWRFDAYNPAGGLASNLTDMVRFMQAAMAEASGTNAAWAVSERDGMVWHNGRTGGYATFVGHLPETGRAVVMLTSGGASPDAFAVALLRGETPQPERPDASWVSLGFTVLFTLLAPLVLFAVTRAPHGRIELLSAAVDAVLLLALTRKLGAWVVVPIAVWYLAAFIAAVLLVRALAHLRGRLWLRDGRPIRNGLMLVGLPLKAMIVGWVVIRL